MRIKKILCYLMIAVSWYPPIAALGEEDPGQKSANPFSQNKFIPDIAFIVDMSGLYRTMGNDAFQRLKMRGFTSGNLNDMNRNTGFNLNYGELSLFAPVDPYFELTGILHFTTTGVEIEEGFINSTFLPGGFGLKAGKFNSGFGRLNSQHEHVWDFADRPIVYQTMFGADGLNEVGAQLTWVAPIDMYLSLGAEALQGVNEGSFGDKSFHDATFLYRIKENKGPNAYVGFLKSSIDAGKWSILYGGSGAYGWTRSFQDLSTAGIDSMDLETALLGNIGRGVKGRTWIAGAELTIKYLINSYQYISFQGEYLYRSTIGGYYYTMVNPAAAGIATYRLPYNKQVSGMYGQLIVKPFQQWRFGGRFELLHRDLYRLAGNSFGGSGNLIKASGMIDFSPTEFTRLRLQYNHDRTGYDRFNRQRINNEVLLQANAAIGAHGAHPY